jgi:hypothetical protein
MIIHLVRISPNARRIFIRHGATIPEDFIGPAALPLFCLAPRGVFRASGITPRAVSSYLAFSPLPALFSKNRRYVFCDTFRQRPLSRMLPAYFTRHAAVWCSDFPPANPVNRDSPAIICHRLEVYHNQDCRKAGRESSTERLSLLKTVREPRSEK